MKNGGGEGEKALCYYAICFGSMHMKCIHLSDFLLQQVNTFFIRDLFEKAFSLAFATSKPNFFSFNGLAPSTVLLFWECFCTVVSFPGVFLGLPLHGDI